MDVAGFNTVSLVTLVLGGLMLLLGLKALLWRGLLIYFVRFLLALCLLAGGAALVFGGLDLAGYNRFSADTPVATVVIRQLGAGYQVQLLPVAGESRTYFLKGDQWQLDVRLLRWSPMLSGLGVDPLYRFERISGRYRRVQDEIEQARTAYAVEQPFSTLDTWQLIQQFPVLQRFVRAQYGSATYLPMVDGARYGVTITPSGLAAQALNDPARRAMQHW